jgi:hypothetical protein
MRTALWSLSLIALVSVLVFYGRKSAREAPSSSTVPAPIVGSLHSAPTPSPVVTVPSVLTLREEVEEDPHSTPGTFLKFVEEVSRRKHAAKNNPRLTAELADHLEGIAIDGDYLPTRAFALRMLRELSEHDSGLKTRLEALEAKLPAQIISLSKK